MDSLSEAREKINEIDREMARLFARRMAAAKDISEYKRQHGLPVLDAAREAELIKRCSSYIKDDEIRAYYINFLKSNMKISRRYQQRLQQGMSAAYCGIEGSFAAIAAAKIFPDAQRIPCGSFAAAWNAVSSGECDCAVLPLENSSNGEVGQVIDLMMFDGSLYVNHIYELGVMQNLLGIKGAKTADIRQVMSHEQALGQSADFLEKHGITPISAVNTAVAAQRVAQLQDIHTGAVGSEETAALYGLDILERRINSGDGNRTRFAVFSRTLDTAGGGERNSILLFKVSDKAGALAKAINIIGLFDFNMRVLRSRPTKDWGFSYYFYAELQGDVSGENGRLMCRQLEADCEGLKIAGTYRCDEIKE